MTKSCLIGNSISDSQECEKRRYQEAGLVAVLGESGGHLGLGRQPQVVLLPVGVHPDDELERHLDAHENARAGVRAVDGHLGGGDGLVVEVVVR